MTDAKSDVLGERELDAVSGGLLCLPLVAVKVRAAIKGDEGTTSGGGQNDPALMFPTDFAAIYPTGVSARGVGRRGRVRIRASAMGASGS